MNNKKQNSIQTFFTLIAVVAFTGKVFFSSAYGNEITKPKIERHFVFDSIPLNLEEIENFADRIFTGTCTSAEETENDSESNLPVIKYTFQVLEGIKGVNNNEEITFKQWKPTTRANGYEVGEKYILFLYPDSIRHLTSTVGVEQGLFEVRKEGFIWKKEIVLNKLKNKGLNRNLKTQKTINIENNKAVNDYIHHCSENSSPIGYKEFVEAIKYLIEK